MFGEIYRQKSRELGLRDRDRNTKCFYTSTIVRRRRNFVGLVKQGNKLIVEQKDNGHFFLDEFENLFNTTSPYLPEDFADLIETQISEVENTALKEISSVEELHNCTWNLHPLRAADWMDILEFSTGNIGVL